MSICHGTGPLRGMAGPGRLTCCPQQSLVGGKTPQCLAPSGSYCGILLIKAKLSDKKVRGSGKRENEGELLLQKLRGASMRCYGSGVALHDQIPNEDSFKIHSLLLPATCLSGSCKWAPVALLTQGCALREHPLSSGAAAPRFHQVRKFPMQKHCAWNFRWSQKSMSQTYTSESNIWPVVLWSFSEYWFLTIKNTWKGFNSNQTSPSPWKINLPQFCCFLEVINISDYVLNSSL